MDNLQLKFCPFCGEKLEIAGSKFCANCGSALKVTSKPIIKPLKIQTSTITEDLVEDTQRKPKTYDLGVNLEGVTAEIHQKMGWSAKLRQRVPTRSGPNAEIDVLITRGSRRVAIECKNYDTARSVGISELRIFKDKLEDTGIASGLFVTSSYFSGEAQEYAESNMLEIWDRDELREKYFLYAIGRLLNPSLVKDPILPVEMNYSEATKMMLRNPRSIKLNSVKLFYHPYIMVKFRLRYERKDPSKKNHVITDEGVVIVDALDGDIINPPFRMRDSISGLLKNKQDRIESGIDRLVYKELSSIKPEKQAIIKTMGYEVIVAEPVVNEESAIYSMKEYVIEKNTKTIDYKRHEDDFETFDMKIVPKTKEITMRGCELVYVPKWDVLFESGNRSFNRRYLASSGTVLEDSLSKCEKCKVIHKQPVVLCEICGKLLCENHYVFENDVWMCKDHSTAPKTGIFSRISRIYKKDEKPSTSSF